jgi:transcriptional repressor NrdR
MRCPFCDADKESLKVIDSRTCEGGRSIRRRRECTKCDKRFTTYERIEETNRLIVVKKDGRRVPWDRTRILSGLERACFKRPVPESELLRVVDDVEEEIFKSYDREVPSTTVGELVTDKLRRLDQVAYVRFASVYREFKTLEELVNEAKAVIDARRFEDPDQGHLFIEPKKAARENGDGDAAEPARRRRLPRSAKQQEPVQE